MSEFAERETLLTVHDRQLAPAHPKDGGRTRRRPVLMEHRGI